MTFACQEIYRSLRNAPRYCIDRISPSLPNVAEIIDAPLLSVRIAATRMSMAGTAPVYFQAAFLSASSSFNCFVFLTDKGQVLFAESDDPFSHMPPKCKRMVVTLTQQEITFGVQHEDSEIALSRNAPPLLLSKNDATHICVSASHSRML